MWKLSSSNIDDCVHFTVLAEFPGCNEDDNPSTILHNYLSLDVDTSVLYDDWQKADAHFAEVAEKNWGIRILRQDIFECLISFICSSNNNISRISSMINSLCTKYGDHVKGFVVTIKNDYDDDLIDVYDFPSIDKLASITSLESDLKTMGFGYRAKYISKTVKKLHGLGGEDYLKQLNDSDYDSCRVALMALDGIGPKVADCICLMGLNKTQVVPIDTHVWQVTCKYYLPKLKSNKSVTTKIYQEIAKFYVDTFGDFAGWAQAVLFYSNLNKDDTEVKLKKRRKI